MPDQITELAQLAALLMRVARRYARAGEVAEARGALRWACAVKLEELALRDDAEATD